MSFEIDTQSFSFITFGKKEKQKPVPAVTEVKTSEVATKILPNKNKSIWYDQNALIEEKKCSATLPTTALVKKLSENSPLAPTSSTSKEPSTSIARPSQVKQLAVSLDALYTSSLKPTSSQLYKNTPLPTENKSTSLNNAQQSGIDLNAILLGKAALKKKPPIKPNQPANNILAKPKKIEIPKIPSNPHDISSIPVKSNQIARNEDSIEKINQSELELNKAMEELCKFINDFGT
ncbi:MAG: hypothetical protein ACRDAI_06545 [Candidatus Rhabdochlamydia sp.]